MKTGPDEAAKTAFVDALNAIDRDIVHGKPDKAVDQGRNQCDSVNGYPDDKAKLLDTTRQRFTSPDHPEGFPPATVEEILDAVKTHLCPSWNTDNTEPPPVASRRGLFVFASSWARQSVSTW